MPRTAKALIVTAIPLERAAVEGHLGGTHEETHGGAIYRVGTFDGRLISWEVVVAQVGQGNEAASAETASAIERFKPDVAILTGIAGGVKDVRAGDVVVGEKVYAYEHGKDEEDGFKTRPRMWSPHYGLLQRAKEESLRPAWLNRLRIEKRQIPQVYIGAIASGEKLCASSKTELATLIKEVYNDTLAIEMEGSGASRAFFQNPRVHGIVIRGISDLRDDKADSDRQGYREHAAAAASAFTFQLLAEYDPAVGDGLISGPPALAQVTTVRDSTPASATFTASPRNVDEIAAADLLSEREELGELLAAAPDPPPSRRKLLHELVSSGGRQWLAATGGKGFGKSVFIRQLIHELGDRPAISVLTPLDSLPEGQEHYILRRLRAVAGQGQNSDWTTVCSALAAKLAGGLLVIDEVPDLSLRRGLGLRFVALANMLSESGATLLTAMASPVLPVLASNVRGGILTATLNAFSGLDIEELIRNLNMYQEGHVPGLAQVISSTTNGHPTLVAATLEYLRLTGAHTAQALAALLTGTPMDNLRSDTLRRLPLIVPDSSERELLYRLSLVGAPVDPDLLAILANLTPPIFLPFESVGRLLGTWLERAEGNRIRISDLLQGAGATALSPAVQQAVHRLVASHFRSMAVLQPLDVLQIMVHLAGARAWNELTGFVLILLMHIKTPAAARAVDFVSYFDLTKITPPIPPDVLLPFRAAQIRLKNMLGEDTTADVEATMRAADQLPREASVSAFLTLSYLGPLNTNSDPVRAIRLGILAARRLVDVPNELLADSGLPLESLALLPFPRLTSQKAIEEAFQVLRELNPAERQALTADDRLSAFFDHLLSRYVQFEVEKVDADRDWDAVTKAFDEFDSLARLPGLKSLEAYVHRWRAIILADFLGDPTGAIEFVERAIAKADGSARISLEMTAGALLTGTGSHGKALTHFLSSLESQTADQYLEYDRHYQAAIGASNCREFPLATREGLTAFRAALRFELEIEAWQTIGELAISYWLAGDTMRAFGCMAGLSRQLDRIKISYPEHFEDLYRRSAQVIGWMAAIANGFPLPDGFEIPAPGFFKKPARTLLETPMSCAYLFLQLGSWAFAKRRISTAKSFLSRSFDLATDEGYTFISAAAGHLRAMIADSEGDYVTAFRSLAAICAVSRTDSTDTSPLDFFAKAPVCDSSAIHEAQRSILWVPVALGLSRSLLGDGDSSRSVLDNLSNVIQDPSVPVDRVYWSSVLGTLRRTTAEGVTRAEIMAILRELRDDLASNILVRLVASRESGYALDEIAVNHGYVLLAIPEGQLGGALRNSFCQYVLAFWRQRIRTEAFRFQTPSEFRRVLDGLPNVGPAQSAMLVLIGAIESTGPTTAPEILKRLRESLNRQA